MKKNHYSTSLTILLLVFLVFPLSAQQINWTEDGNGYYKLEKNEVILYTLPSNERSVFVSKSELTPAGQSTLPVREFYLSSDKSKVLIYTNTKRVWRLNTEGDYWVLDLKTKKLQQVGRDKPASSLRFAKFSPDGSKVAYVSEYNLYVEDLAAGKVTAVTTDGHRRMIYGTFDWAYEEEFACRDGFQWSPDGEHIAFWKVDATGIRDFYMINNTDSIYSQIIPVEYPKVGQSPSSAKIGVYQLADRSTVWLAIPGDPQQHYIPRIGWNSEKELFVQQLNRKQNQSILYNCNISKGSVTSFYEEKDDAWIDVMSVWDDVYGLTFYHQFQWINKNKEFIWTSEQDGWKHLYRITTSGKSALITKGDYDVMNLLCVDERNNLVYFHASPKNATQQYLYRTRLDGKGEAELVTPAGLDGTHTYKISPSGQFAMHRFQNSYTKPVSEFISLPGHQTLTDSLSIANKLGEVTVEKTVEFFKVNTEDGVEMDGFMVKPENFDSTLKYPLVFYVYTEPWGQEVKDIYGIGQNGLYRGDMAKDGYIYIAIDNRGTPAPKGSAWRKSIYRKIGRLNISDQAQAAKEILKWKFVDPERIAVWGWSGGGSATLNLLFRYPEIYKTGIAIAAVANQLTYDNIYQERYMGLPQENMEDFVAGSPITYAKNLEGNLLYIHGTGDDNVHFANAEMLVNELIKYNKQFQYMPYPNRSHGISEGEGTFLHLSTLYTNYLKEYCPGGGIE